MPNNHKKTRNSQKLSGASRFKNFFIPHAGNNYEPQVLKTKRVLFHALSLVVIKMIVVIFIIFYPLTAWLSTDAAYAQTQKIIALTNNLRTQVHLAALKESAKLDTAAYDKVHDMLINQYFAHVSPSGVDLTSWLKRVNYQYSTAGENLATGYATAEQVVAAWQKSPAHYDNIIDPNFKEIGVAMSDGRFDNAETVLAAQYFARPELSLTPAPAKTAVTVAPARKIAPAISGQLAIKGDNLSDVKVIQAAVSLPTSTVAATVIVNAQPIALTKATSSATWTGTALVSPQEAQTISQPLVPATISVQDSAGAVSQGQLDWTGVNTVPTSPLERYNLFKEQPSYNMLPVLSFSNVYFQVMLLIAMIAFALNIFIEIRKQKVHLVVKSLGMLILLFLLIIL